MEEWLLGTDAEEQTLLWTKLRGKSSLFGCVSINLLFLFRWTETRC